MTPKQIAELLRHAAAALECPNQLSRGESWRLSDECKDAADEIERREWSGAPCPADPDNFWIDDETGERIPAR